MKTNNDRLMWLGGTILPVKEAKIAVMAPTSQFGANVFEGIRGYWNEEHQQLQMFRLEDHYKRLLNSIKLFKMDSPYTIDDFRNSLIDIVRINNYHEDIAVRQTVFIDGFGSWSSTSPVNMFVAPISKARKDNENLCIQKCCISSWTRISDKDMSPRAKVGANYINSRLGQLEAIENGYDTCIFLNDQGKVAEGPGSCLFIIRDNVLITPPLTSSVLESITRDTILNLAKNQLHMQVEERIIDRTELYICDEAFLCGSAMEIGPIGNIDGYLLNDNMVGPVTKAIHKCYLNVVTGEVKEFTSWLTPIY